MGLGFSVQSHRQKNERNHYHKQQRTLKNKIEGTPILKLAMIKRLKVKKKSSRKS